jgi:hypothetical protein
MGVSPTRMGFNTLIHCREDELCDTEWPGFTWTSQRCSRSAQNPSARLHPAGRELVQLKVGPPCTSGDRAVASSRPQALTMRSRRRRPAQTRHRPWPPRPPVGRGRKGASGASGGVARDESRDRSEVMLLGRRRPGQDAAMHVVGAHRQRPRGLELRSGPALRRTLSHGCPMATARAERVTQMKKASGPGPNEEDIRAGAGAGPTPTLRSGAGRLPFGALPSHRLGDEPYQLLGGVKAHDGTQPQREIDGRKIRSRGDGGLPQFSGAVEYSDPPRRHEHLVRSIEPEVKHVGSDLDGCSELRFSCRHGHEE